MIICESFVTICDNFCKGNLALRYLWNTLLVGLELDVHTCQKLTWCRVGGIVESACRHRTLLERR